MKHRGNWLIGLGLLFLAAALVLTAYNLLQSRQAASASQEAVAQLEQYIAREPEPQSESVPSEEAVQESQIPDYLRYPDMEMPVTIIEDIPYIGILEIPALELTLPVISQWSYPLLKIAPCRYEGSAYQNNLIIMAHNYASHFGSLSSLRLGDTVTLTDVDGNIFSYQVVELETLQPTAVEEMESGQWDLTLFTCTTGGQTRLTVRCALDP